MRPERDLRFFSYVEAAKSETRPEHEETMASLDVYLALVPVGTRSLTTTVLPEVRRTLFEERGGCCEACSKDLSTDRFDVHHTDYTQSENPDFLKILCLPCHGVVNYLTGVKWWFARETGRIDVSKAGFRTQRTNFWQQPGFEFDAPEEE